MSHSEEAFEAEVRANLRRNYIAYLIHGVLGQTGMRLINAPTFIPAYVHLLSGSDFVVGIARALQDLGMFLTPLVGAKLIESRRRVLPLSLWIGAGMRVQVLGIALAGFFAPDPLRLVLVCAFLGFFGLFLGIQGVAFGFRSKLIPGGATRGAGRPVRVFTGGLVSAGVAGLGGWFVAQETLGDGCRDHVRRRIPARQRQAWWRCRGFGSRRRRP